MRQRRAQHDPSIREKPDPKRRGNFLGENKTVLLASGVIAAAAFISFVVILLLNGAPPLQPRERVMLTNYEEVRVSLAHDDLTTAERLAAKMAREFGDWVPVSSSVQLIANSDSLESARKAFAKTQPRGYPLGRSPPRISHSAVSHGLSGKLRKLPQ